MPQPRLRLEFPNQGSPITRWLALVVAAVGFAVAMTLGLVFFVFFLGLALVAFGIVALRVWWLKRKLGISGGPTPRRPGPEADGNVIEGEYHVLDGEPESHHDRDQH